MLEISVPRAIPQIERQERQAEALVLRNVPELVAPDRRRRFHIRDDHVAECDRAEAATSQNEMCEPAIAYIEKAAVTMPRKAEREEAQYMADGICVMRSESAENQGRKRPGRTVVLCAGPRVAARLLVSGRPSRRGGHP